MNSPTTLGMAVSSYKSVKNKLSTRVDFPKPDSPEWCNKDSRSQASLPKNWINHSKTTYARHF